SIEVSLDGGAFSTTGVACTGCGNASATWTFTPASTLTDGNHTIDVHSVDNAGVASAATRRGVSIDTAAPVLLRVDTSPGTTSVTLTFDQAVSCATVAAGDFTVTVNGTAVSVTGVTCSGAAAASVTVSLGRTIRGGDTVAVSLTATAGGVADPAGNVTTSGSASVTVGDDAPTLLVTSGLSDGALTPSAQPAF